MSRRFLLLSGLGLAGIAVLAGIHAGLQRSARLPQAWPAVSAEAVARLFASSFGDVDGKVYDVSRWQGKTLVLNFWGTWCPPCRDEMPAFSRLQILYAPQGVQFVGIALDSAEKVREFSGATPVSYPLLIGGTAAIDLARDLGNTSLTLPYTVLVGPDRQARLVRVGPLSESELARALQETFVR